MLTRAMSKGIQATGRVTAGPKTALFVCDIQEKFRGRIHAYDAVIQSAGTMISAARLLAMPVVFSEQYPKALGHTVAELSTGSDLVVPKTLFSMCVPEVEAVLAGVQSVVLVGIEAHVCVQQTALDLAARGINVHVLADAVSSQAPYDRAFAFERMRGVDGVFITTMQSCVFELARDAKHPSFKAISQLMKTERRDPLL